MDKTELTIKAYNLSAVNFQDKFMDLKLYKDSFEYLYKYFKPNFKILDLGCGPGNVAKYLLEKDKTLKVYGIDLSEEMIKLARKNVPEADFSNLDIRKIDFKPKEFDIIIASFCLPFLYNEEAIDLIKKIASFLKESGIIYLSTMEGNEFRFEKPSFCEDHKMFFNYYEESFLIRNFEENKLNIEKYFKQDYYNKDGSIMKDMIFILKK